MPPHPHAVCGAGKPRADGSGTAPARTRDVAQRGHDHRPACRQAAHGDEHQGKVLGQFGDHAGSLQPPADLRRAGRILRLFARLLLAAANGDDRFASRRGRTARTPTLRGLQGHAQRGRTPRLSLGSLKLWRRPRRLPAPREFQGLVDRLLHRLAQGSPARHWLPCSLRLSCSNLCAAISRSPCLLGCMSSVYQSPSFKSTESGNTFAGGVSRLSAEMKRPGPITKIFLPFNSEKDARTARNAFVSSVSSLGVPLPFMGSSSSNGKSCHPRIFRKNAGGLFHMTSNVRRMTSGKLTSRLP